ncbi:MAG: glycosyl transferase family 2, partial [Acidobacteria bacterium]|nr:glycosyl transferase family 2 [Acidobacteriota bacterium]
MRPQLAEVEEAIVTVVDNGSTDGSIAAVTARHPYVRFLPLGTNRGFTGGVAAGVARTQARNVVFLNNDAVPEPGWLASLVRSIDDAPADVVSVGGRIVSLDGQSIDFIGGVMTFDGHAFQPGFRMPLGSRPEPAAGAELLFACGGNMITRREALVRLGGFDDDYFAYLEDVDFGWRTWLSGGRAVYDPRAVVRHHSSATSNRLGNFERGVFFERNAMQTALKNFDDDLLHEAAGAMFFAYLHRLHHFTSTRNADAAELTRAPFAGMPASDGRPSLLGRIRRKLFGAKPLASIDDPLTAMQFRAFDWIVRNAGRIAEKRATVQALRVRSDREIFEKFPLYFV